jgi:hypothetical protein
MARYHTGRRTICGGENIMMIVLGHFLIAAAAVIATSAIIGYFLTKLLLRLLQKVDRSIRLAELRSLGFLPTASHDALKHSEELLRQGTREVWAEYINPPLSKKS